MGEATPAAGRVHNKIVAAGDSQEESSAPDDLVSGGPGADRWQDYARAAGFVGAATVLSLLLRPHLAATNLAMVFLLAVVIVAARSGRAVAVVTSFLSVAAFDFFCVPPYYTFVVEEYEYIITFGVMLIVALVISSLTAQIRANSFRAAHGESRTKALYRLSSQLAPHTRAFDAAVAATEVAEEVFDAKVTIFLPDDGRISFRKRTAEMLMMATAEEPAAQWCFETARKAGFGTRHYAEAKAQYLPLKGVNGVVGVMAVFAACKRLPEAHLLGMFASQTAAAIERIQSQNAAESARLRAQTEEMRSSLLSAVSHDVRTPLATIQGAATTLRSQAAKLSPEVSAELLDSISDEAERLGRLVGNILDMTRLESGIQLRQDLYPIEEIVGAALQRLDVQLVQREVITRFPEDVPLVSVDDVLIGQVLANLIENAVKYTPAGSPIEISARAANHALEIEVCDRGPGFASGEEIRIFEKFYRVANGGRANGPSTGGRAIRGAGLGLPICKAIVEAHKGTITAADRAGGGAVFRIVLPVEGNS
ncbi:MAG: DUF4118 domain-containing protein [Bryobacteraceae bacterium]